jgi:hypothetical protein
MGATHQVFESRCGVGTWARHRKMVFERVASLVEQIVHVEFRICLRKIQAAAATDWRITVIQALIYPVLKIQSAHHSSCDR